MEIEKINKITSDIINCAIEVHKALGPGLLESAYKECLSYLLKQKNHNVEMEVPVPIVFMEIKLDCGYRIDLLVDNEVVIEAKSIEALAPIHTAQVLTHLRFAKKKVGLLINFNVTVLKNGIKDLYYNFFVTQRDTDLPAGQAGKTERVTKVKNLRVSL